MPPTPQQLLAQPDIDGGLIGGASLKAPDFLTIIAAAALTSGCDCYEFRSKHEHCIVTIILAVQMLSALAMIGLILIQHGKGADMGAAFGSGGSGSLFGASGSANFLSRTTAVLAAVFFVCTLALAYFGNAAPGQHGQRAGRRRRDRAGAAAPARCGPDSRHGSARRAAPALPPRTGRSWRRADSGEDRFLSRRRFSPGSGGNFRVNSETVRKAKTARFLMQSGH